LADGMGDVMNEGSLEGWKMQKHVQMNVEVKETSIANLVIVEVDLQKTIEIDVLPSLNGLKCEFKLKIMEEQGIGARSMA